MAMRQTSMTSDTFSQKLDPEKDYLGTVIENKDPNCAGRCKVRVFKLMDGMDDSFIPWASPANINIFGGDGGGNISIPKKGTTVRVRFNAGEIQSPEWFNIQKLDPKLVEEIKNDYIDTHVLLYDHDHDLSVIYQPNNGIRMYLGGSYYQISPDGMITINHTGETAIIQLVNDVITITTKNEITINGANNVNLQSKVINLQGTESTTIKGDTLRNGAECAVNGMALMQYLQAIAKMIDLKYPTSPSAEPLLLSSKASILNRKIKYV